MTKLRHLKLDHVGRGDTLVILSGREVISGNGRTYFLEPRQVDALFFIGFPNHKSVKDGSFIKELFIVPSHHGDHQATYVFTIAMEFPQWTQPVAAPMPPQRQRSRKVRCGATSPSLYREWSAIMSLLMCRADHP